MQALGPGFGPAGKDLIRKRTQRRFIWLASVALGLLLFAPSISRVLYAWSADTVSMVAMAGGHAGHASHGHAGMPDHVGMPEHPGTPEHPGMPMNGDVCGYCTLMCHNPALASALAFVILPPPRTPYSTAFAETRAPVPALLDRRSRGPPAA